ncbi:MAG: hypothetical protein VX253_08895, partial [Bacteroidota bacterium]|nr:hypothetical protein [Bacteroidota bacterium]
MTKDEAIKRLQKDTKRGQRFNDLLPLLGGMKAPQQHRYFNRAGYSAANLKSLEYDIKQAYGIKSADLRSVSKPAEPKTEQNPEDPEADKNPDATSETTTAAGSTTPAADQTPETTEVQKDAATVQDVKNIEVKDAETVQKSADSVTKETVFVLAPEEVKKDVKLRERYPF